MSQGSLFGGLFQTQKLNQLGNPLKFIDDYIDWEIFRKDLEDIFPQAHRMGPGRKPYPSLFMFKVLVIQNLYNLSDAQTEYQIIDRYSFREFLGISDGDSIPDEFTIRNYRKILEGVGDDQQDHMKRLFLRFGEMLAESGYQAQGGTMVDAQIIEVPRQQNTKEEDKQIKEGKVPESFSSDPKKLAQKDCDARWTKKGDKSYFGYKNHANVDVKNKMIRDYVVTDASVHDSKVFEELIESPNSNRDVYGDKAYRGEPCERAMEEEKRRDRIHRKAKPGKPLSDRSRKANRKKSQVRARIEHVFGHQSMWQGGRDFIRGIGIKCLKMKIGMRNLIYNLQRYAFLEVLKTS